MKETRVASRYARSLIKLAEEQGELNAVHEDMTLVRDVVRENRELKLVLENPIIRVDLKEKVIHKIFAGKIGEMTMKFMDILLTKRREHLIDDVAEEVTSQFMALKNRVSAEVISASPLSDEHRKQVIAIMNKMDSRDVEIVEKIDKELIGGFIIRLEDNQLDYSVARLLKEYRQEFSKNAYIADL